jgi:GNAT superfamily N-acetyltransferase
MAGYPGSVRIVEKKDEEELMALCRQLYAENGLFKINEDKVCAMLHRAFNRQCAVMGVIGDPGKIQAMIFLLLSTFWYSDDPHFEEILAYVVPAYRRSGNAIELMKFAKWCSNETGYPLLIGVISNERTESKVRLYQRQFQKPIGNFFFYRANGKDHAVA